MSVSKEGGSFPERQPQNEGYELYGVPIPPLPESEIPIVTPDTERMPTAEEYPFLKVKSLIQDRINGLTSSESSDQLPVMEAASNIDADFAVAVHSLSSVLRQSPLEIAKEFAEKLNSESVDGYVLNTYAENGYLNFETDNNRIGSEILSQVEREGDNYGELNIGDGKNVVIDCSAPNIAKFMSIGHLRSTIIGESLSRIYRAGGYTSIRDNHLGDWGTQFGMLGRAYELWGEDIPEIRDGTDPVKGLYDLYVKMHDEIEKEKEDNPGGESQLQREGREWFRRLEEGDPQAQEMWEWTHARSLEEFQRVYDLLGAEYEYQLGESVYIPMLPAINRTLEERGVATVDESGALIVDLEEAGLPRLVVRKSDGTSLYASRDMATLITRKAWFNPDKILYAVGSDQSGYFQQVFKTFDRLDPDNKTEIEHTYFGMVSLPEGKMSTRRGRVVFLEDVMRESISKARELIESSDKDLTEEEIEEVSRQVGVGALIYADLGQGRERDIQFDMEKALSLETNSGPYIQYTHARALAVLRRAEEERVEIVPDTNAEFETDGEIELIKQIGRFPQALQKAIDRNQPSTIAEYTFKTADLFNKFYQNTHILSDKNEVRKNTRLRLTAASAQAIRNGLNLLGIESPEKM